MGTSKATKYFCHSAVVFTSFQIKASQFEFEGFSKIWLEEMLTLGGKATAPSTIYLLGPFLKINIFQYIITVLQ